MLFCELTSRITTYLKLLRWLVVQISHFNQEQNEALIKLAMGQVSEGHGMPQRPVTTVGGARVGVMGAIPVNIA